MDNNLFKFDIKEFILAVLFAVVYGALFYLVSPMSADILAAYTFFRFMSWIGNTIKEQGQVNQEETTQDKLLK